MKTIRRIGKLSRRGSYDYEPEQVARIFAAVRSEIDAAEKQFTHQDRSLPLFRLD